jgi:simple sugar transport system substrate-binding protein/ribose transport system substrate-binding protein
MEKTMQTHPQKVSSLLIACVALIVAGCGQSDTQTTTRPSQERKLKLAGIVFQEDQYFRLVQFGMQQAAKEGGVELLLANSNNKPEKEIELVNTYIARKVDAIVISPISKEGSVTALKLAHDKGIRVLCHSTLINADFYAAHVECSPSDLGQQTGKAAKEYIEKNLGGKAKVAIVAFKSQVPEQSDARTGGFKAEVMKLPGVEIVAEQDAWLPEMAVKKVGDILTANPDVNIVYAANEGGTIGAVLAVKGAGKAGQVTVFGTDSSQQLLEMLQSPDNILQAITSQRPVLVGRMAVESAIKVLKNQPVEKKAYLPGILLSRADPEGVKKFAADFKTWTQQRGE